MYHIESSNQGYKWDWNESSLRGKLFGGVFGEKEYEIDGNTGFFTTMRYTCEVNNIDNIVLPKPLLLNKTEQTATTTAWESEEALPF